MSKITSILPEKDKVFIPAMLCIVCISAHETRGTAVKTETAHKQELRQKK